ncbi:MAG: alanine racemase [Vicinamibacteria bacterium]|nr:alanine racemase [Vicinamibacteria bacterium]
MTAAAAALARLRPTRALVDLDRIAANYRALASFARIPLVGVVKADAYGHGAPPVARALAGAGCERLAVALPEEGAALRAAGIDAEILVLAGFWPGQLPLLREARLVAVVSNAETLRAAIAAGSGLRVHVKVDTGMTRLGFDASELVAAADALRASGAAVEGVMTHLASADEDAAPTAIQLDRFDEALAALRAGGHAVPLAHAANSAGLAFLRPSHTLARPGLLLYGVRPRPLSPDVPVLPAMRLVTQVAQLREVEPGTAVSYGGRFVARRPSRIATLPIGYADGVPRARTGAGTCTIHGARVPVAGTVCMDLTLLDVTDRPDVREGDEVEVFGGAAGPAAWDVADWAGTNAWQVLTGIGARVPRVYTESGTVAAVASRY